MNIELSKKLPKAPAGLGWQIEVSGDGSAPVAYIRLVALDGSKGYHGAKAYAVPATTDPGGVLPLIAQQAREVLKVYERWKVVQTLAGFYDGTEQVVALFEAEFQEKAA